MNDLITSDLESLMMDVYDEQLGDELDLISLDDYTDRFIDWVNKIRAGSYR